MYSYAEHTGKWFYRTLRIRVNDLNAAWAYEEMISSLTEHTRKCLKVKYLGRIEHYFQNSRVTGPGVGLGTKLRSKKIPRNRLGMISVILRKCSFRGISSSAEEAIPKLGTEQNGTEFREKIKFYGTRTPRPLWLLWHLTLLLKFWAAEFCVEQVSLPRNGSERNSDSLLLYFFHGTEFRVVFSSAEGFGRELWEYSSIFVSTERNSELFSLPLKCSEGNSESSLLFGTDPDRNRALEETPRSWTDSLPSKAT